MKLHGTVAAVALTAGTLAPLTSMAATPAELATKAGCAVCHQPAAKSLGPSYRDVAKKYQGRADAPALIAERVRKGSTGVWGPLPMTPTPAARLSDAELKTVIDWVLKTP